LVKTNPRNVSLSILEDIYVNQETLTDQFEEYFVRFSDLSDQDKRFIRFLVKGTLEHHFLLCGVLRIYSKTPIDKLKPVIRIILLQTLQEVLFMHTTDYAAVSEALKLVETRKLSGLKGFVNGILRTVCREKEQCLAKLKPYELASLPESLFQKIGKWIGKEKRKELIESLQTEEKTLSVSFLQSNISKAECIKSLEEEKVIVTENSLSEITFELEDFASITGLTAFQKGYLYVQDATSALAATILAKCVINDLKNKENTQSTKPFKALDLCASPGGKSFVLYDQLLQNCDLLSCDLTQEKVARIDENKARLHFEEIQTRVQDATVFVPEFVHQFDIVIADVPCSGLGIIHEKPDILLHVEEENRKDLLSIQEKILQNAIQYVRPGGYILFSTCTIDPAENLGNFEALLKPETKLTPVDFSAYLPEIMKEDQTFQYTTARGYLTLLPGRISKRGFFISILKKDIS